jgi:hypothetical protein
MARDPCTRPSERPCSARRPAVRLKNARPTPSRASASVSTTRSPVSTVPNGAPSEGLMSSIGLAHWGERSAESLVRNVPFDSGCPNRSRPDSTIVRKSRSPFGAVAARPTLVCARERTAASSASIRKQRVATERGAGVIESGHAPSGFSGDTGRTPPHAADASATPTTPTRAIVPRRAIAG